MTGILVSISDMDRYFMFDMTKKMREIILGLNSCAKIQAYPRVVDEECKSGIQFLFKQEKSCVVNFGVSS